MAVRDGGWWPLIPRESRLTGILKSRPREHRLYLIEGPAGIGKSQLARSIAGDDALVVTAIAERSTTPLGVLDDLVAERAEPDLSAAAETLSELARSRVVLVDDAPRLDAASAEVIRRLIMAYGLLVVATARSGEPLPEPLAAVPVLREELAHGFSAEETSRLLEECFRVPVRPSDVQRLVWATGGNPLHLRIEVEAAVMEGRVLHRGSEVELVEGASVSLTEAVASRIAALAREDAALLALVARVQPVARDALAPRHNSLAALTRLGLVVEEPGGRIRVSHPLVSDAVAAQGLHADLGETLRVLRASGGSAQRFAALRLERDAGVSSPLDELLWAGAYAAVRGDHEQAAVFAEEAASRPASRNAAFTAHLAAATYRSAAGDLERADDWFVSAADLANAATERAALACAFGAHLAFGRGDAAAAVAQGEATRADLSAAEAVALDADLWRWRTLATEGGVEIPDAIAAAVAAAMRCEPASAATAVALLSGRSSLGEHAPTVAIALGIHRLVELRVGGDAARAAAFLETSRAQAGDEVGFFNLMLASHRAHEGRLGDASDLADLAIDQLTRSDPGELLPLARAVRATLSARRGELDDARERLEQLDGVAVSGAAVLQLAECRAHLLSAEGRPDAAANEIMAVVGDAVNSGYRFFGTLTLSTALRFGDTVRTLELARALAVGLADPIEPIAALIDLAGALEHRRLSDVPDLAKRLAQTGLVTAAIDGASIALGMPAGEQVRRRIRSTIVALSSGVDAPAPHRTPQSALTPREWQVARAAADRLRSREIAQQLGVSTRTVDNQLHSVYRKLGVSSRDELREALDATALGQPG